MEKQYINLNNFEEFNTINNCIDKMKINGFAKDYYIQDDELYEIIGGIVQKLELELTSEELNVINETMNYFKGNDYDSSFINNANVDSIMKAYNFIYWKYKNKNSDFKIDLIKLKKLLGLKLNGSYQKSINISIKCKNCNGDGEIIVSSYDKFNEYIFKCSNCNHTCSRKYDYIFPLACNCEKCAKLNEDFFNVMKENFNKLLAQIEDYIISLNNKYLDIINTPSDFEMIEDWKLYRLDLDRDLREIFSYKPKDIQDLIEIVDKIDERNNYYNEKTYRKNILDKLYKFKILYRCSKTNSNINKDDLIKKSTHMLCGNICKREGENVITNIKKFIDECKSLEQFKIGVKLYRNGKRLAFGVRKEELLFSAEFGIDDEYKYDIYLDWLLEDYIVENNYFFNYDEVINIYSNSSSIKKIFQSGAEKSMFINLRNKYSKNIILPNYKIKDIIDLGSIKKELSISEYDYLIKEASFNFVICDLEGVPLKVIQVQRGKHHNEKEWIRKDKIKEKVCKIANLEFEEVF